MLTADRYEALTGQSAPDDLPAAAALAETLLHARTMQLLRKCELTGFALETWEQALALQTAFIIERGGVAALAGSTAGSITLGRFSVSSQADSRAADTEAWVLSPAAAALLPTLIAIGRGLS